MSRFIACEDCGQWEETTAKNTKRCHVCRLIRNLDFVRARQSKCWRCNARYCPIARDDQLCPNCAIKSRGAEEIDCAYCGEHKTSVARDIVVCMGCARDVAHRKKFHKALVRKQEERRAEDPGPKPLTFEEEVALHDLDDDGPRI